ncbi:hypothetical protein EYF80_019647 [Liparis tanakae]|uniref:Uncharacterized protein n=1 Tax=Liparis tanakae TaxID=230148 RepID=A0A4Z2HWB7_9TELE|nr:hypothetical protein EYF80_019647 [Liparis tanakae]
MCLQLSVNSRIRQINVKLQPGVELCGEEEETLLLLHMKHVKPLAPLALEKWRSFSELFLFKHRPNGEETHCSASPQSPLWTNRP